MPKLYNIDHQPTVVDHGKPAVGPGESYDFTKEQIEAGLTGVWSEEDPRKGLKQEREFKRTRDKASATPTETDPAEPEKE